MKIVKKVIFGIIIFGVLTFIGFLIMIGFTLGGNDMCGNNIIETKYSPNQKYKLVVFQRSCGATTDFSYQVSVLNKESNLENTSANIFVIDRNSIKVKWITDKKINIEYQKDSEVFQKENNFQEFDIEFTKN